jgi:carbonic anhydrase
MLDIIYRCEMLDAFARPRPTDSAAALRRLTEGNRDFANLLDRNADAGFRAQRIIAIDARDLGLSQDGRKSPDQHPFAAILGCSDARVPLELIFNEGPNDIFVIRVAGNVLGDDVLGSLKYAVDHLGSSLKLIVVLGHSGCGAVTAAVDAFLDPTEYLPLATQHSLRTILDSLLIVVQASARKIQNVFGPEVVRRPGYRAALIEASTITNAALAAHTVQQEIAAHELAALQTVFGVYLLESRRVWAPCIGETAGIELAVAPRHKADFTELGDAILRSDRIAALIGVPASLP